MEVSSDLNLSRSIIPLMEGKLFLGGKMYTLPELREIERRLNGAIMIDDGVETELELFAGSYFKLRPTEFAPTIEIDGVRMHRTKNMDPMEDARQKARCAVKSGDSVLDTCGGLGYTAIQALECGAKRVVTVEKETAVRELRALNPHSRALFCERVTMLEGSVYELIENFADNEFDSVIHDPPRFSFAGELYGKEFYKKMNRALKPKGRLFHYTGDPYSKGRGRRFIGGVMERLSAAGFKVSEAPRYLGVSAVKIKSEDSKSD